MKKSRILAAAALAFALLIGTAWGKARQSSTSPSVELGEHLVTILACNDCHTPLVVGPEGPAPDMSRMLSGHPGQLVLGDPPALTEGWGWIGAMSNTAFAGPWGVSYAANLTPHPVNGLGIWTEEMFVDAIRTGRHMGLSRQIQPPMPWPAFSKMTDRELRSIYAYLRTIPPVDNLVPDYREPGSGDEWEGS